MKQVKRRLPHVISLSKVLPAGTEGGKEFARIVDLLLFHQGRREGKKVTIFNDSAGDYNGLDSFEGDVFRKDDHVGYQYKFFPSPLSSGHKSEIESSLKTAAEKRQASKIRKWVLVTPDDFVESGSKKGGGDVSWFENLTIKLNLDFEIEHWGHKQLIALFLDTPSLCLFYYPELVHDGLRQRKSIVETRDKYDKNLLSLYRNIEFVGMSIYKPEATRGVPMESIYIPLQVVPEIASGENDKMPSINPLRFTRIGMKSVILGDPGSGKSTLLKFLALRGISRPLQKRYKVTADDRLPLIVILRRYSDELKTRKNLSIVQFTLETIQSDFNLPEADLTFFEYYLNSGKAIVLFDGLDELPDPNYKQIVRNQIRSLNLSYPGNTIIVTSRIVGYENPFRFEKNEFQHYTVRNLQLPEIEQFVHDWYKVRIESETERLANIKDLIRIIRDENHIAIRELAENPLLLTIVALVHRLDAVLPDERVVLYQKCTETLLNTWHTWKFRDTEVRNRGKIERRNRRRMEAIANWMQQQSTGVGKKQRSIVPFKDLLGFLSEYISDNEKTIDSDDDPQDLAADFLEFIKKRAGLLIEVGDEKFSFLHLTFQEYLTSSFLITSSEKEGITNIWNGIRRYLVNPRWHEVIRLFVAGLKSEESQEFLVTSILKEKSNKLSQLILLGGLILDGVTSAEIKKDEIFLRILSASLDSDNLDDIRSMSNLVRNLINKDTQNEAAITSVFTKLWGSRSERKDEILLLYYSLRLNENPFDKEATKFVNSGENGNEALGLFFSNVQNKRNVGDLSSQFKDLSKLQQLSALTSPLGNFLAVALAGVNISYGLGFGYKSLFELLVLTVQTGIDLGPHTELTFNLLKIVESVDGSIKVGSLNRHYDKSSNRKDISHLLAVALWDQKNPKLYSRLDVVRNHLIENYKNKAGVNIKRVSDSLSGMDPHLSANVEPPWELFLNTPEMNSLLLTSITEIFGLKPSVLWYEALRVKFLPNIPALLGKAFSIKRIEALLAKLESNRLTTEDSYIAAVLILTDGWLHEMKLSNKSSQYLGKVVSASNKSNKPPIIVANVIREIMMGHTSKIQELKALLMSDSYKSIFGPCLYGITSTKRSSNRKRG